MKHLRTKIKGQRDLPQIIFYLILKWRTMSFNAEKDSIDTEVHLVIKIKS